MENSTFYNIKSKLYYSLNIAVLFFFFVLNFSYATSAAVNGVAINSVSDDSGNKINTTVDIDLDDDGIINSKEDANFDGDNNPATHPTDTDGDGIPNYLDIDSDNDGILDNVEAQTTAGYIAPCGIDTDGNGLDDHYEATPGSCGGLTPIDTDSDSIPDYLDIDSDNDGILDNVEAQTSNSYQPPCGMDGDGNGLDDHYESPSGGGEGITPVNTDGDNQPDFRDLDSDNDGILDNVEAQPTNSYQPPCGIDTDGNGLDDHYETHPGDGNGITPVDTDGDHTPDCRDLDSDDDGCFDTMEAGFLDAFVIGESGRIVRQYSSPKCRWPWSGHFR